MDRLVRLYQLWGWLPHFRAIAETEHLPSASSALGVSPSALSRALKQLEQEVGTELFVRDGRTIRLNDHGRELLASVRTAMRAIDDALTRLSSDDVPITVRVSAPGPVHAAITLNVVEEVKRRLPQLDIELSSCSPGALEAELKRGNIDVAIHETGLSSDDLDCVASTSHAKVVACATSHPLATADAVGIDDVSCHPFVAPPPLTTGEQADGWPAHLPRDVGLRVTHMQMGIDACRSGRFLVLLPRLVTAPNELIALDVNGLVLPESHMFVTTRKPVGTLVPAFHAVAQAIAAALAS